MYKLISRELKFQVHHTFLNHDFPIIWLGQLWGWPIWLMENLPNKTIYDEMRNIPL